MAGFWLREPAAVYGRRLCPADFTPVRINRSVPYTFREEARVMAKTIARPSKSQYRKGYVSKAKDASPTRTANSGTFSKKTHRFGEIGGFGNQPPLTSLIRKLSPPDGGTEINRALLAVLGTTKANSILLVTDGRSHAIDVHALAGGGASGFPYCSLVMIVSRLRSVIWRPALAAIPLLRPRMRSTRPSVRRSTPSVRL